MILPFLLHSFNFCFRLGVSSSIISHFTPYWMANLITYFMFCGNLEEYGPCPESLLLKVSNVSVAFPQNAKPGHRGRAASCFCACGTQHRSPTPAGRPPFTCGLAPHAGRDLRVLLVLTVGSRPQTHCPWAPFRMKAPSEKLLLRILYLRWALVVNMGNSGVEVFLQYYFFFVLSSSGKQIALSA